MRTRDDDKIPVQATGIFVIAAMSELNVLVAPSEVASAAGRDAWLSVLLGFVGLTLGCWLVVAVVRRHPGESLVEIVRSVLGRGPGTAVVLFYIVFWTTRTAVLTRVQAGLFGLTLLPATPETVVILLFLFLSTYLARHGVEPMSRFFLLTVPAYLAPLFVLIVASAPGMDLGRLQPVLGRGGGPVLEGALVAFAEGPGVETLLMVGPHLLRFDGAMKSAMIAMAYLSTTAVLLLVVLIARFGGFDVSEHVFPTLSLVETIDVPGFSGLRLDPVFNVLWFLAIFCSAALSHYAAASALYRLVPFRNSYRPVYVIALAAVALTMVPTGFQQLLEWNLRWRIYTVPAASLGIPLILYAASRLARPGRGSGKEGRRP